MQPGGEVGGRLSVIQHSRSRPGNSSVEERECWPSNTPVIKAPAMKSALEVYCLGKRKRREGEVM